MGHFAAAIGSAQAGAAEDRVCFRLFAIIRYATIQSSKETQLKFVTYRKGNATRLGIVDGQSVIDLNRAQPEVPADIRQALLAGIDLTDAAQKALKQTAAADRIPLEGLSFAPLV